MTCGLSIQSLVECLLPACLHPGKGLFGGCSLVRQSDCLMVLNEGHLLVSLCLLQAVMTDVVHESSARRQALPQGRGDCLPVPCLEVKLHL